MSGWAFFSDCSCGYRTPTRTRRWRLVLDKLWHDLRAHRRTDRSATRVES